MKEPDTVKKEKTRPPSESRQLSLVAAEWLAKRDRGFTASEQDEFLQWLAADARHGDWLARHEKIWREFNQLTQWRPEHSVTPNPDLLAQPRRARRLRAIHLLAMAACVALAFVLWQAGGERPADEIVAASYERRVLEDGSTMELNRGAVVRLRFSAKQRSLELRRGEAHFTVVKDVQRPFVVHARTVDVRAVGTAFNVKLADGSCEVVVTEGRVALARSESGQREPKDTAQPTEAPNPISSLASWSLSSEVVAGQRAIVSAEPAQPPRVTTISADELAQALAWQPRWLDFSSTPLAQAIAELNRRNRVQLVLADAELGSLPIVASIRSDNVDGFVHLLTTIAGVQAERNGPDKIVLRKKP